MDQQEGRVEKKRVTSRQTRCSKRPRENERERGGGGGGGGRGGALLAIEGGDESLMAKILRIAKAKGARSKRIFMV